VKGTVPGGSPSSSSALAAFLAVEARIESPIMPLRVLGLRSLVAANLVRGFMVTGAYSTFFLGALYLEHVRGLDAIQIGLAFLAVTGRGRSCRPAPPLGWWSASARGRP
jgi:hypothetical protein